MEIRKLKLDDPTFPAVLRDIPSPPQQLYVLGELSPLLARPRLAVVGTRKITTYGQQVTTHLVGDVVSQGVVIVSGLAYGVDGLAHEVTIRRQGQTIAILASGLNNITPVGHSGLAKQILDVGGALISEYPPNSEPKKYQYIARNRLIAGISNALIVPEAGSKSGSLHTAQFAVDQGKRVMAIPSSIYSPQSAGCNQLIKDYAIPVTETNDVLFALGMRPLSAAQLQMIGDNPDETEILQLIQKGINTSEALLEKCGFDISKLNKVLTRLEVSGRIFSDTGSIWFLK